MCIEPVIMLHCVHIAAKSRSERSCHANIFENPLKLLIFSSFFVQPMILQAVVISLYIAMHRQSCVKLWAVLNDKFHEPECFRKYRDN